MPDEPNEELEDIVFDDPETVVETRPPDNGTVAATPQVNPMWEIPQPANPLRNYLTEPVIALLRNHPTSHSIRAIVTNECGFGIPDELTEFEAISKYIIEQQLKLQAEREKANAAFLASLTADQQRAAAIPNPGITIDVHHRDVEYGNATYNVRRSGIEHLQIPREELIRRIHRASDYEELRDELLDFVADNNSINTAEEQGNLQYGDFNYEAQETTETDEHRYHIESEDQMMVAALQFIREHMPDDLANFE